MGVDLHALQLFLRAKSEKPFGQTVTLGRQNLRVSPADVARLLGQIDYDVTSDFTDSLLMAGLGASSVDSIDNSAYENATILHNMNAPIPLALHQKFDTVIDCGTLEHVFDIATALRNCTDLCKIGGQILHVAPANNFCGHGFWQFSPELFFTLYSQDRGYAQTEVFLAELSNTKVWYQVKQPEPGARVDVLSHTNMYVIVRTTRAQAAYSHENVQQSDYVYEWSGNVSKTAQVATGSGLLSRVKKALRGNALFSATVLPIQAAFALRTSPNGLNANNPNLRKQTLP